jgi:hypothetical protein
VTVRLDRLQQGVFELLNGCADVVAWAMGEQPKASGNALSLRMLGYELSQDHARGTLLLPPDSLTIRVTSATVGKRLIARLNAYDYRRDVVVGDTPTTIRNALLGEIQAGELGSVTAAADGSDGIALTALSLGAIRSLHLVGPGLEAEDLSFSGDAVLVTEGTALFTLALQSFSGGRELRNGAMAVMGTALDRFQSVPRLDALRRFGVSVRGLGNPIDISAIASGHWETRAACEVHLGVKDYSVSPIDTIETAVVAVSVNGETVQASVTAP